MIMKCYNGTLLFISIKILIDKLYQNYNENIIVNIYYMRMSYLHDVLLENVT